MRPSRGMGCIAKDKMPGSKPRIITRKDKPQFVKEYVKGGPVKKLAEGGETKSKVNEAGNYTKPSKREALFKSIKASATHGTAAGQWSARKAQLLAKRYKESGGGYK
jgi:hypothetical protein